MPRNTAGPADQLSTDDKIRCWIFFWLEAPYYHTNNAWLHFLT